MSGDLFIIEAKLLKNGELSHVLKTPDAETSIRYDFQEPIFLRFDEFISQDIYLGGYEIKPMISRVNPDTKEEA